MEFVEDLLPGATRVRLKRFEDARGSFVKTYSRTAFSRAVGPIELGEEFYSISHRDVLRGMHFQRPPHDHAKAVYCARGAVLDVLLDLRPGDGYGRSVGVTLRADDPALLLIPSGVAHGFLALEDDSLMVYKTSTEHAPTHDAGIRWDSFGFAWPLDAPIVSDRDRGHAPWADFRSPF